MNYFILNKKILLCLIIFLTFGLSNQTVPQNKNESVPIGQKGSLVSNIS